MTDKFQTEVIERIVGLAGKAYRLKAEPNRPEQVATLDCWFLDLPGSHPLWSKYSLSLVHLRDIPGVPPANKAAPWVECEMMMYAFDPSLKPDYHDVRTMRHLVPLNYVYQFAKLSDGQAIDLTGKIARMFVAGRLIAEPQGVFGARDLFLKAVESAGALVAEIYR